jgi:apolipoprotein N-acyltransferase
MAVLLLSLGLGWVIRGFITHQSKQPGALSTAFGALFFLPVAFLTRHPTAAPSQVATIALIQTNVPQDLKMGWGPEQQFKEWQTIEAMTARAAQPAVGLIVWPETMMPGITIDDASVKAMKDAQIYYNVKTPEGEQKLAAHAFADRLRAVQQELKIPIIVGEEGIENLRFVQVEGGIDKQYDQRFNSAFTVQDGKVDALRYDKLHLTPFGEEMPYISKIKWLKRLLLSFGAQGMKFDLAEGRKPVRLLPRVKLSGPGSAQASPDAMGTSVMPIATPICFEIADSSLVRSLVQSTTPSMPLPTTMIITITNDGWFGDSDMTRRQHVQLARWRAAELGIPVLRCANTGDSCGFDAWAKPIAPQGLPPAPRSREEGICMLQVPLYSVKTLYSTIGNALGWAFGAFGAISFALTFRKSS